MSNMSDSIKNEHIKKFSEKKKMDLVIAIKFMKSCKDYGFRDFIPPTRADVKKAENVFKLIKDSEIEITVEEFIESFVSKWSEFNLGGLPDLGKIPLVYKKLIPETGYRGIKVQWRE